MANKREVDELKLPPDPANALKRAKEDVRSDAQEIRARSDDAGPSHESREACLDVTGPAWPKHKIFLSHSGVHKPFTDHLCKEPERVHHSPFFDRRDDSLRKGERFYSPLMTAAQTCRVAVLVLSEEFFTASKWPMMELNEFVKAQKLDMRVKVLPLYFQISREELGNKERQARWIEEWKVMASKDASTDVKEWEDALRQIAGNNGMPYGGNTEGEAGFIDRVVEAVCRLLPSDVQWDVSHVRSMNELSQPILRKFEDVKPRDGYHVRVVGVYGMGGAGKTTISRAICNELFGDFVGKVCYIEFGKMEVKELLKIVLQELTEASSALLKDKHHDQLLYLLKERLHQQKVFLVLDNVMVDDHRSIAHMFLDVRFCDGSMVLVTSRSLDMLEALEIQRGDCLEMPNLEEESAIDMFLHYSRLHRESMGDEEWKVIRGCVQECYFLKNRDPSFEVKHYYHYLPLALKVLGIQLSSIGKDVLMWKKKLGELRKGKGEKFNLLKNTTHPIFSVLRLGYDTLCIEEQHIFLDLAVFWPLYNTYEWECNLEDWQWMSIMHEKTEDEIQASVNILQRKGLLESVYKGDELKVNIHDLYKEFAKAESQGGPFERRHSLVTMEAANRVPNELLKYPPNGSCWPSLKRLGIWDNKVCSLSRANLRFCKNVELLDLRRCEELEVVDVTGMDNLRSVMVYRCYKLREWIGLEKLHDLVILRFDHWNGEDALMPSFLRNLSSLTALRVLELRYLSWSDVDTFPPDLSACTNLQEVIITCARLRPMTSSDVQYFGNRLPKSVMKIDFCGSSELVGSSPIRLISSFTILQELSLRSCKGIRDVEGLCELTSLQKLDVAETNIRELPGNMGKLKHLQALDVSRCRNLSSLGGISQCATTLRRLDASWCTNLRDLPDDFSCFQKLERVDMIGCRLICTLPKDYERLAGRHPRNGFWTLKIDKCFGLVVPLVEMLRLPKKSHVNCVDPCNCGGDSMQLWIDGRKHVNRAAYKLLRRVFLSDTLRVFDMFWTYMLDEGEVVDFVIRALCEHDDRDINGTHRLLNIVWVALDDDSTISFHWWWIVVMTAPCTFGVIMERAKLLEPWSATLVHYTISFILPNYAGYLWFIKKGHYLSRMGEDKWLDMAMKTLLRKCKENLEKAIVEGILPVHSCEGKKVVDIFLGAVHTAKCQGIGENSIWTCYPRRYYYRQLFPMVPFKMFFGYQKAFVDKQVCCMTK